MKKLLLALLFISPPFSVDAQVKDTLNKELNQDLMKFKKTKRTGCILFAAGIPVTLIGIKMMDNSIECYPTHPSSKCNYSEVKGVGVSVAGLAISSIGMSIWIMAKRNEIIYKYRHYSLIPSASVNGIGLIISF